ncbi:MAG: glutaredoxin domain-containing protein [Deltaproteobacteria bacterium]
MAEIIIYSTAYCPYCRRAKAFFDAKGFNYTEIDLTHDPEAKKKIMDTHHWRTVPMILINGVLIGGYDDLMAMDREKKLDDILRA